MPLVKRALMEVMVMTGTLEAYVWAVGRLGFPAPLVARASGEIVVLAGMIKLEPLTTSMCFLFFFLASMNTKHRGQLILLC